MVSMTAFPPSFPLSTLQERVALVQSYKLDTLLYCPDT